jgi:signal transduction histidine kinase
VGSALRKRSRPSQAAGQRQAAWVTAAWRDGNARLLTVAVAGLLAGAGAAWIVSKGGPDRPVVPAVPLAVPLALLIGWSFVGSGLLSWRPRPGNLLGPVLVFTGFAWFASMLPDSHNPVLFTIGAAVYPLFYVGIVYLVISFPSGRLHGPLDRGLVVVTIGLTTVVQVASLVFADSRKFFCRTCPANLLEVAREDAVATGVLYFQRIGVLALALTVLGLMVRRWRRASRPERRAVLPVVVAGALAGAAVAAAFLAGVLGVTNGIAFSAVLYYATAAVSVAVLLVFLQRRMAQGAVAGLVVELGRPGQAADLRGALSRALGDPSLALAYWVPAQSRYVDTGGRPVELPEPGAARTSTVIERDGQPVAALIHDPALQYNPGLVDSVCAAAGLTLDNERLAAELRARLVELQASRARLVTAADEARRRIERDLHDGAQQQLVALRISLGLARQLVTSSPGEAADLLAQTEQQAAGALAELRELARGIYPPLLADLGLGAALEAQARKAALPVTIEAPEAARYPQEIEAAVYFCVLEALQNVAKYAQASAAQVALGHDGAHLVFTVTDDGKGFDPATTPMGTGLQGMADRLSALGGTLEITSAPGQGTRVTGRVLAAAR